jgi:hypothetical protein
MGSLWTVVERHNTPQSTLQKYLGFHVKCPEFLLDFNQIRSFSTDFRKSPQTSTVTQIRPIRAALLHANTRTDRHDEAIGRFSLFMVTRLKRKSVRKEVHKAYTYNHHVLTKELWNNRHTTLTGCQAIIIWVQPWSTIFVATDFKMAVKWKQMWYTKARRTGYGLISTGYTKPGPMTVRNAPTVAGTMWKSGWSAVQVNLNCSYYSWQWRTQNTGRTCCTLILWLNTDIHTSLAKLYPPVFIALTSLFRTKCKLPWFRHRHKTSIIVYNRYAYVSVRDIERLEANYPLPSAFYKLTTEPPASGYL